jgi:hypothetical protein
MMRNQRKRSSEVPSEVKIRKVVPEVPCDETERGELLEDLQRMGCLGLLEKPWGFKDDRIVRELLDGATNEFDNTIRATPTRWTEECWREVYNFSMGGGGLAGRKDEIRQGLFQGAAEPQGRVRDRGLHGSVAQAGACVSYPHPISGKAKPDNCYLR